MYGRISAAPSAQLSPTASGFTWRTAFQNASGVWPDSVRPDASVIVPDTMSGRRCPTRSKYDSIANSAALALSVSKMVSTRIRSAPPSARPRDRFAVRRHELVVRHVARARIVDVGRDRRRAVGRAHRAGDEARLVRRARGPRVGALARDARRGEVDRRTPAPACRSRPARCRSALNVLVSTMSAPAARYSSWIARTTSGCVSTSRSLSPLRSCE